MSDEYKTILLINILRNISYIRHCYINSSSCHRLCRKMYRFYCCFTKNCGFIQIFDFAAKGRKLPICIFNSISFMYTIEIEHSKSFICEK